MGIKGLHKILNLDSVNIQDLYKYKNIGVDASIWLHKLKYVDGSALGKDRNHDGWKEAFKSIFKELNKYSKLIFVFDGKTPDFKMKEHEHRREKNEFLEKTARKLLKDPRTEIDGRKLLVKLIEVEELAKDLKEIITNMGCLFVDSEYESDRKLADMSLNGEIDLILTEDTDLIVYGCSNILFRFNGRKGMMYDKSKFENMMPFKSWDMFQKFCVMCGCDYIKFKGIAYGKALKICKDENLFNKWEQEGTNKNDLENIIKLFR